MTRTLRDTPKSRRLAGSSALESAAHEDRRLRQARAGGHETNRPRNEAARLSNLTREAAASQLGRLFARLPDRPWTSSEIRRIASTLVELLPTAQNGGEKNNPITSGKTSPIASGHLIYLALALALALALSGP